MGRRGRTTRGRTQLDVLLEAPWQVSVVVGAIAYVGLKWVLPAIAKDNILLKPISIGLTNISGLVAVFFFFVGVVVYVKQAARRKQSPVTFRNKAAGNPAFVSRSLASVERGINGRTEPSAGGVPAKRGPLGGPLGHSPGRLQGPKTDHPFSAIAVRRHGCESVDAPPKPTDWSIDLIRDIEWKRFEDLCQKFYEAKGIKSATTPLGPDGGIDIRLYCDDGKPHSIVQCKAWNDRFVGVKPVRELLGVMTHEKIEKAFFMTSGRFSDDAKTVAKNNRITLIDGEMFLMMLKRLPENERSELLKFATGGDYKTPTCPKCGITMKQVEGKTGRPDFWGCHSYPRCRQILPMRGGA